MADEGGVTLKIDANTAAYIAKISQLADSHEKVTKHVDGWGAATDHVVTKLAAMAGPLVIAEELARKAGEAFADWKKDIQEAGESAEDLITTLRKVTAKTGESREQVMADLNTSRGSMSQKEAVQFYGAFRGAAPGSVGKIGTPFIGRAGAQAEEAGFDLNEFAQIAGNLYGSAGDKSFDQAAMLERQLGGSALEGSELMKRTAQQLGGTMSAGDKQRLISYMIASAKSGDRRFSFIRSATEKLRPGQSLDDAMNVARASGGALAESVFANLPSADAAVAGSYNELGVAAASGMQDAEARRMLEAKTVRGSAEQTRDEVHGERANEDKYAEANRDLWRQYHPVDAFFNSLSPTTTRSIYGRGTGIDKVLHPEANGLVSGQAIGAGGNTDSNIDLNNRGAVQLLEEQNAILKTKVLKPDAHRE